MHSIQRKSHFLGTKIKSLRKRNNLTLEDLSIRCIQMNPESAPSISYLSMIENGKRVPSEDLVEVIATIFQKQKNGSLMNLSMQKLLIPHQKQAQ